MCKRNILIILAFTMGFLLISSIGSFAGDPCVYHKVIQYLGEYSDYYTACNAEMRTTFSYQKGLGYQRLLCGVDGTPFQTWYSVSSVPGDEGQIVEWTHCSSLENHRAYMTFEPIIIYPPPQGFVNGTTFTVDYFAKQEE